VETQAQTVLTLDLDQITKFVYCLDGALGEGNIHPRFTMLNPMDYL
jgi:hypothetical protein